MAKNKTVSTRKPSIKNLSLSGRLTPKDFLKGSLYVQPIEEATKSNSGGGYYDYKRIQTLQSSKIQFGWKEQ